MRWLDCATSRQGTPSRPRVISCLTLPPCQINSEQCENCKEGGWRWQLWHVTLLPLGQINLTFHCTALFIRSAARPSLRWPWCSSSQLATRQGVFRALLRCGGTSSDTLVIPPPPVCTRHFLCHTLLYTDSIPATALLHWTQYWTYFSFYPNQ